MVKSSSGLFIYSFFVKNHCDPLHMEAVHTSTGQCLPRLPYPELRTALQSLLRSAQSLLEPDEYEDLAQVSSNGSRKCSFNSDNAQHSLFDFIHTQIIPKICSKVSFPLSTECSGSNNEIVMLM